MTSELLADLTRQPAWALIRRQAKAGHPEPDTIALSGSPRTLDSIMDIDLADGPPAQEFDSLAIVPFHQITERGFKAIDDGTPLVVIDIDKQERVPTADLVDAIDPVALEIADNAGFDTDDGDYAEVVERIINDEIGQGEGANLVIGRHYRAVIADWGADKALSVFRRLVERERGAYWTFCVFTGDRFLIGASPERHVSVHANDVRMNPISGTFRLPRDASGADLKPQLLDFLADEKELYELFMVVDEELKMMCDICQEGGQVLGPFLKPMTHLIHTEYLLAGRSHSDVREILRDTMYAATVTGSPVENACKLISEYETEGRGYYASAMALFGRDEQGRPTMDSPILIRTADVSPHGELKVTAGATLVRDSDAAYEVAETHAKAGGILSAFGLVPAAPTPATDITELTHDEDVLLALNSRNRRLSSFWLADQGDEQSYDELKGKSAVILDNEDDFVNMLRHVLGVLQMSTDVVRWEDYEPGALDGYDLVIIGPGPGDPRDGDDPKIRAIRAAVAEQLDAGQPTLAVCLGHQALCHHLGLELHYKDIVFQGTQSPIEFAGRTERVGFYNTFVGRVGDRALPEDVTVGADPETGDVNVISGPQLRGIQFHAESILSQNGFAIIETLVKELLTESA